jgi:hypothetical protein
VADRASISRDGLAAGAVAALAGGVPSTLHALATGRDPLAPTVAAGTLVMSRRNARPALVLGGALAHAGISVGWASVLAALLPRRQTAAFGALAGVAIAALDFGLIGRRNEAIRALPLLPQFADHLVYGAVVGAVVARRRLSGEAPAA